MPIREQRKRRQVWKGWWAEPYSVVLAVLLIIAVATAGVAAIPSFNVLAGSPLSSDAVDALSVLVGGVGAALVAGSIVAFLVVSYFQAAAQQRADDREYDHKKELSEVLRGVKDTNIALLAKMKKEHGATEGNEQ